MLMERALVGLAVTAVGGAEGAVQQDKVEHSQ